MSASGKRRVDGTEGITVTIRPKTQAEASSRRKATAAQRVAEWADRHYRDRPKPDSSRKCWRLLLDQIAGRAPNGKVGLPELPAIKGTAGGIDAHAFIEGCQEAAEHGYGMATLVALRMHLIAHRAEPVPEWIAGRVCASIDQWRDREFETLDEAFQAKRPRGNKPAMAWALSGIIWQDVQSAGKAGIGRSRTLYEEIANRYSTSAGTVERIVAAFENLSAENWR